MTASNVPQTTNRSELWRLKQLALVSQVATQVTSILELDELFVRVVGLIYQTFEFYAVSLYTLEGDYLVLRAQAGPAKTFSADEAFIPTDAEKIPLGKGIIGWVAANQQELVVTDVWKERRFRYSPEFPNTEAEIALPLKVEDRLLGVLDVQLDYPEDFDESDLLVLRALAGQVSMAIEDTRLYAEAARRGEHLATISAVSWAIASILDVDRLLEQVCELIRHYFHYPCVQVFTVNPGRGRIEYRAGSGRQADILRQTPLTYPLDDPHGIIPLVARTGETILANDVTAFPAYRPSGVVPPTTRSELTVPLVYNEEVLGVLDVQSDEVNAFTPDDRATMETLAANIGVALRNANLYRSERWRRQVADSLRRISGALITDVDLQSILKTILAELKRNLPADALTLWLFVDAQVGAPSAENEPGQKRSRRLLLSTTEPADVVSFEPNFEPRRDPWLQAGLHSSEPVIRQPNHPPDPVAARLGYPADHSAIVAPLQVQKRRLGLLTLTHHEPGKYGAEAHAVTTAFANQAAIAIENARLFHVAQTEARISRALLQVAEAAQDMDNLEPALVAITQVASLITQVEGCAIWLRQQNDTTYHPTACSGLSPQGQEFFQQCLLSPAQVPALSALNRHRQPVVILNAAADARFPANIAAGLGVSALALLPIVAHGDMLGLMLVSFSAPALIRHDDIRLLSGIARQAAVAIESKFLYDQKLQQERLAHELQLAKEIQTSLIPARPPDLPGWELAACWRAAQEVAGDFYDFIEVSPHRLGLVIADVSGKGLPAAMFMALTRSLIRAVAPGQHDPRAVLTRVNQLLLPDTRRGKFVSLFYAILDTQTGELTYSNAGHNPPFLLRGDGTLESLALPGIVLGVKPDIEPQKGRTRLLPGDGVVFYTDGVTEVFNDAADIFGEARLRDVIQAGWDNGPQALVDRIQAAVNRFSATALPHDDFTLLILRRQNAR
ncbi:MAG: GAF domain-containing protein [Chloroflexi bacterium]|nr:MAG: GAF domain-containing protein [Chloroflexota bacterium]